MLSPTRVRSSFREPESRNVRTWPPGVPKPRVAVGPANSVRVHEPFVPFHHHLISEHCRRFRPDRKVSTIRASPRSGTRSPPVGDAVVGGKDEDHAVAGWRHEPAGDAGQLSGTFTAAEQLRAEWL